MNNQSNNIHYFPNESVEEWNERLAVGVIPNNIILCLYILLGVTGNSIVIFVYGFRMKKNCDDRYFIPILASSDLVASAVCSSFGIAENVMQVVFTNGRLCKAWWFFAAFSQFTSVFLLLVIATQRYLKLCRPIETQMNSKHKQVATGITIVVAVIMAAPTTAIYGSVEFPNHDETMIGMRCGKLKSISKSISLGYGILVLLVAMSCIGTMIYFYGKIGHTIIHHFKSSTAVSFRVPKPIYSKSEIDTDDTMVSVDNIIKKTRSAQPEEAERLERINKNATVQPTVRKTKRRTAGDRNRHIIHKFTIMFMIITVVFFICYIPKVTLMIIEGLNPEFWEKFNDDQRPGVLFIYRMYIINNIVNPIIYAFMDPDIRYNLRATLNRQRIHIVQ